MTTQTPSHQAAEHRRQRYIKGSFQRRFIVQFCALLVAGCVAFGVVIYLYGTRTLTTAFVDSKLRVMSTAEFLLPALGMATAAIGGVVAVAGAFRLLWFSHQIAGPLYRFERSAEVIGDGDLSATVKVRAGDELQGVARSMDGMVTDLRTRVKQIRTQSERLHAIVGRAKQTSVAPREFLQELEETQHRLDEAISRFRV